MYYFMQPFRQYSDFSGRSTRREFWMFYLLYVLTRTLCQSLDTLLENNFYENNENGILETIFMAISFIPFIALSVRRMHDVGKSGWFLFIPFYNLYLALSKSDMTKNKWG